MRGVSVQTGRGMAEKEKKEEREVRWVGKMECRSG